MNNWTEVIERATDLDKQLKYEEAFEVIQAAVQEADAIIESGRYCDTDEIKYADKITVSFIFSAKLPAGATRLTLLQHQLFSEFSR